jgi:hypothetical protein
MKKLNPDNVKEQIIETAIKLSISDVRPEVIEFAVNMEQILRLNDYKGGWKHESLMYLFEKIREEYCEINECILTYNYIQLSYELKDLANSCMMLDDKLKGYGITYDLPYNSLIVKKG